MLRDRSIRILCLVSLVIGFTLTQPLNHSRAQSECPTDKQYSAVEKEFVNLLNVERSNIGAQPLFLQPLLTQAATLHSQDMVAQQYFSHTGLDGSTPSTRAQQAGYTDPTLAENIAVNSTLSAQDVLQQWLDSPGHRRNMLNPTYNLMGLGMSCGTFEGYPNYIYYTQMLGVGEVPQGAEGGGESVTDGAITETPTGDAVGTVDTVDAVAPESTRVFATTDGSDLAFAEDSLFVTLPKGWKYAPTKPTAEASPQIDFQNDDLTIAGLLSYPVLSKLGWGDEFDPSQYLAAATEGMGTVESQPEAMRTTDGHFGAKMTISGSFGFCAMFVIVTAEVDRIVFGEFCGAADIITGNVQIQDLMMSIRTKKSLS